MNIVPSYHRIARAKLSGEPNARQGPIFMHALTSFGGGVGVERAKNCDASYDGGQCGQMGSMDAR